MSAVFKILPVRKYGTIFRIENRFLFDSLKEKYILKRNYSDKDSSRTLTRAKPKNEVGTEVRPLGERVKENTKTASYMGVILIGVGVTAGMFYTIFKELFSSKSPNGVYSAALEKCIKDYRVEDALGAPLKGFGEETRRGRRGHVAHTSYIRDGIPHMRMVFYIKGSRNKAQVQLEVREGSSGDWEYRYLLAQLEDYPRTTIILEDNRLATSVSTAKKDFQGFL